MCVRMRACVCVWCRVKRSFLPLSQILLSTLPSYCPHLKCSVTKATGQWEQYVLCVSLPEAALWQQADQLSQFLHLWMGPARSGLPKASLPHCSGRRPLTTWSRSFLGGGSHHQRKQASLPPLVSTPCIWIGACNCVPKALSPLYSSWSSWPPQEWWPTVISPPHRRTHRAT